MKKLLLFSILAFLLSGLHVFAYETVIVKYPDGELWEPVYYRQTVNEGIAQYVLKGDTSRNWGKTVIIHAYNNYINTARTLLGSVMELNQRQNPTSRYTLVKNTTNDAIAVRCTNIYKNLAPQCEILRAAKGHKGVITIHYINKNITEYRDTYDDWYDRIKKAIFYESYFRNDRVLNKALYLEL